MEQHYSKERQRGITFLGELLACSVFRIENWNFKKEEESLNNSRGICEIIQSSKGKSRGEAHSLQHLLKERGFCNHLLQCAASRELQQRVMKKIKGAVAAVRCALH
jgi:hypothetical protein